MDYPQIKLDKKHQPINPSLCINNQLDYDYYIALLNYLYNQYDMGFTPKHLVSLHNQNPAEYCKLIRETIILMVLEIELVLKPQFLYGIQLLGIDL